MQAQAQGADFLLVGTMFSSRSHPGEKPAGPELVRRVQEHASLPLIGIGGIDASNAGQVVEAGARGVAVIGSILASPSPREAARQIKQAMRAAAVAARSS
jgi:thiamine-phosphate diphosphorylase